MHKPETEALRAIDYLYSEGFIVLGYRDGEPAIFLSTDLKDAQKAIKGMSASDNSGWWKHE